MSLVNRARVKRPWWRRLKWRPELVALLAGLGAFALQLVAGWPGWVTPESIGMWTQARIGPFTDWYPPVLTWLWAQLDPVSRGPFVPFLLQVSSFWAGVTLLTIGLQPAARWTRFLPLIVLINPAVWMVVVVGSHAAVLCIVTLGVGVASLALRCFRSGDRTGATIAVLMASVIVGLGGLGRGSLVPLLLLISAVCVAVLPAYLGRGRLELGAKAVVLTLVSGLMVAVSLPLVLIGDVVQTRITESGYALDAFHIDCAPYWATGTQTTAAVSPPELWQGGKAPCADGSPGAFGAAWTGIGDPTSPQVLTVGDWFGFVVQHPAIVIGGRLQHAASLLLGAYPWTPDVGAGQLVAAAGAAGAGSTAGLPNRGGLVLAAMAAVTAFVPDEMFLWIVIAPIGVGVWTQRRAKARPLAGTIQVWPLLLWPSAWALGVGLVTPMNDASVIAPAAVLGWVFSLWALGTSGVRVADPGPQLELSGGPYPGSVNAPKATKPARKPRFVRVRKQPAPSQPVAPRIVSVRHRHSPKADADLGPSPLSAFLVEHNSELSHAETIDLRETTGQHDQLQDS